MLTPAQAIASILVMSVVTFLTRALPFLLFDRGEHPPKLVLYLGKVLPPAIIAMLIVYCLRNSLSALEHLGTRLLEAGSLGQWLPAFLSVALVVVLHLWKKNNLLSIFGGTILYMVLVQQVFV